jgi:DNA topoisomerase-3
MDFARALGVKGKKDGYLENEDYIVTWAVGHLVELLEPQDYDSKWGKWRLETLPIIPEQFRYKPIAKTKKQLNIIRKLLAQRAFDMVVIATDAGREGEVIARSILITSGFTDRGNVKRFWTSQALTPQVIRDGMKSYKPASEYDRLWRAGQSRQIADWLVGMNGSRAATIKMKDLFSVGRVQTAVLALLVDRRRERENFKPKPYWLVRARFSNDKGIWWGTWFKDDQTRFDSEKQAKQLLSKVVNQRGRVLSVKKQKKKQAPPLLYSLTDLQRDANRKFGFSAQKTLSIAQALYEKKKCLSYPRTDSRVLGSRNVSMAQSLVKKLSESYPQIFAGVVANLIRISNKRVFNDAKLTDHHALIPLTPIPQAAREDEHKIYRLVLKRFAAAFHPDCEYEQTEIVTEVQKETFRTKGKRIFKPGWRVVYGDEGQKKKPHEDEPEHENYPPLARGDPAHVEETNLEAKKTTPPAEYTEALLLGDMTNPARYVSEDELKNIFRGEVGLGTQATRAQIIETLLTRRYIERMKRYLMATDKGCLLIDTLRQLKVAKSLASPEETARWEMQLHQISQGQGLEKKFLSGIKDFVERTVEEFKVSSIQTYKVEAIGQCPRCGGTIIEGKKGYGCSNWKKGDGGCHFVIWKTIAGKKINSQMVQELLVKKRAGPLKGFVSKRKKQFSASLRLVQEDGEWKVQFDFPDSETTVSALGKCPACGGEVVEGTKGYGCANWREKDGGCKFVIWKTIAKKKISKKAVTQLLKNGITETINGFKSKGGNTFSARLKVENDSARRSGVAFEFSDDRGQDLITRW